MGRTNPTFRDVLRRTEAGWGDYRRGLRHEAQVRFDRLFEHARRHADASGYQNPSDPMAAILLSIALEQERRLDELEARLEAVSTGEAGSPGE